MANEMNNEDTKRFGIYHFALKYLAAFEIEFEETTIAISWVYDEGRKEATIYKKPLKTDNGCIYYGEIFDKHAVCKCKYIDILGANAFINEAQRVIAMKEKYGNK